LVLSTIMSRIQPRDGRMRDGMRTQEQAMAIGRPQRWVDPDPV
jgi:hypothetical protein